MKKFRLSLPCRGTVMVLVTVALVALLGMVVLAVDIGMISIGAQRAQQIADAGALTGVAAAIHDVNAGNSTTAALTRILANVDVNNASLNMQAACGVDDIEFYGSGDAIPGFRTLSAFEEAVKVTAQVTVPYNFGKIFGLEEATLTRSAIAVRVYAAGASIVPIWMSYWQIFSALDDPTPHTTSADLHSLIYKDVDANLDPLNPSFIPSGNFGLIAPKTGVSDLDELLSGVGITPAMAAGNYVSIDEIIYGKPGVTWGKFNKSLKDRIDRGIALYPNEYWNTTTNTWNAVPSINNPRLIIVPLVSYVSDAGGANASYRIEAFGAFFLEAVENDKGNKIITGRFIDYTMPGMDNGAVFSGLYVSKLIR